MRSLIAGFATVSVVACAMGFECAEGPVFSLAKYPDAKRTMISLTFDDGTWDHYSIAAPLMEKYGYRGIFSIIPERLGNPKYMNWSHVKDLKARGHEIANHSMSHANLVQVLEAGDTNELKRQIVDSLGVFEENAGFKPTVFCFPYTSFNEELYKRVLETGQVPIMRLRFVFKSDTSFEAFESFLNTVIAKEQFKALLFHGIAPQGRGWEPFRDAAGFERVLQELKSREDEIHVGGYSANMNYSRLQNAAEVVVVANTEDKTTYRLTLKEGNSGLSGELAIVLGEKPLDGDEDKGSGTNAGSAAPLPVFSKVLVADKIAILHTNSLNVIYFNAAIGDTITFVKPSVTSGKR